MSSRTAEEYSYIIFLFVVGLYPGVPEVDATINIITPGDMVSHPGHSIDNDHCKTAMTICFRNIVQWTGGV